MPTVLLQNGTVLVHRPSAESKAKHEVVALPSHCVLICNSFIASIAPYIEPPNHDTRVIDCTGKIVSPGFIDTHHHVWQTQSKGCHSDQLLLDYLGTGSLTGATFAPRDVFWGQLAGCLESIDAGTTTVLDHSNINYSPAHSEAAISATISSGIRSFYGFTPVKRLKSWDPFLWDEELLPSWEMQQLEKLATRLPCAEGRIKLAFGFDWYFLPKEIVTTVFEKVRGLGIKLITSHYTNTPVFGGFSIPAMLAKYDLLKPDLVFSHANQANPEDVSLLNEHGCSISSTPDSEMQLALGLPVCFTPGLYPISSLGADCHSMNSPDLLSAMRLSLQFSRGLHNQKFLSNVEVDKSHINGYISSTPSVAWKPQPKNPRKLMDTVQDAFNLGTILGAKALKLDDQIGSLEVGKCADIVVFDATTPSMACAAEQNPVAAIVQHASVRDVELVMIDGQIRKERNKLTTVTVHDANIAELGVGTGTAEIQWDDVVKELRLSRERLRRRWDEIDFATVTSELIKSFHINEDCLVDEV